MSYAKDSELLFKSLFHEDNIFSQENNLFQIITSNSLQNRLKIAYYYDEVYAVKNLIEDMKSCLSSQIRDICFSLFMSPTDYDCLEINNSFEDFTHDTNNIYELITSRNYTYLQKVKEKYKAIYNKEIENEIRKNVTPQIAEDLIICINTRPNNEIFCDLNDAKKKARMIWKAEPKDLIRNKNLFKEIFVKSSALEMIRVGQYFHEESGKGLINYLEGKLGSKENNFLKEVIYNKCRPSELFAVKINKSIKGLGIDLKTLNRIIVTRNEVDMPLIRNFYEKFYKNTIANDISKVTKGTYKDLLTYFVQK